MSLHIIILTHKTHRHLQATYKINNNLCRLVTKEEFQRLASTLGFSAIQPQDEEDYLQILNSSVAEIEAVAAMPSYTHPVFRITTAAADERTYTEPLPEENPLNGWRFRVRKETCVMYHQPLKHVQTPS